jgi:hypothetical protein
MKTIPELLDLMNEFSSKDHKEMFNKDQPLEWVKLKKSVINETDYQYNDIELIEGLMDRMFKDWYYEIKHQPVVNQDKNGGFAVTVSIELFYLLKGGETSYIKKSGISTEYVSSIKMLPLATPKASSMAFKNAAKKIGKLFGNSLNRNIEEAVLLDIQIEKEAPDRMEKRYKMLIDDSKSIDELMTYQFVIPSSLKDYYQNKKNNLTKKNK